MRSFRPDQGLAALAGLIADGRPRGVVVPIDWPTFREAIGPRPPALVGDLLDEQPSPAGAERDATRPPTLAEQLAVAPPDERVDLAEATVRRLLGRVLKMPESRIDGAAPFGSLGLDSLLAIELRNAMEVEVGVKLSATMAWNYPTVVELRDYVLTRVAPDATARPDDDAGGSDDATGPSSDVGELAAAVAALDDDDALRALMGTDS